MLAVELFGDGRNPLLGELAHGPAKELVLFRKVEVHYDEERRRASSVRSRTP